MDKRDEIRGGLMAWMGAYGVKEDDMVKAGIELFGYLDSMGIVIKADRELPRYVELEGGTYDVLAEGQLDGLVATERLIKE